MLLRVTVTTTLIAIVMIIAVNCKVIVDPNSSEMRAHGDVAGTPKQLLLLGVGKETTTPDFVRLVAMRFIYGLASSMGVEDRLESLFNGAFVPPNADGDLFGFGGLGGGDDGGGLADLDGLEDLFEGDGLFAGDGF